MGETVRPFLTIELVSQIDGLVLLVEGDKKFSFLNRMQNWSQDVGRSVLSNK
jgi:hypothetical protein